MRIFNLMTNSSAARPRAEFLALAALILFHLPLVSTARAAASQKTMELRGEVVNEQGYPIKGVVCSLAGGMLPASGLSTTSGSKGGFSIRGLLPGTYNLTCSALGYRTFVKVGLRITETPPPLVHVEMPTEKKVVQEVVVRAGAGTVAQQQSAPATRLSSEELTTLPLAEQKFKAALPLVPGVLRTPDGKINIRGSVENQGMLLIDSGQAVSPVTGSYDIDLSVDAIQSLNVYKAPFDAEYGGFSGGLTTIDTKAPATAWDWDFNDFFPGFRGRSGHLVGINDWDPRFNLTGPLWKNLTFSEALIYNIQKIPVRGLAWPHNETKIEDYNSFTEFQYVFSPQHLASWSLHLFPRKQEFANINSLLPQSASSNIAQRGFSVQGNDNYQFKSGGILTSLAKFIKFDANSYGQGVKNMRVTPSGYGGNYFNDWARSSSEEEGSVIYRLPPHTAWGTHDLKIGGDFTYRSYAGSSRSRPVEILRNDGTLAEQITFLNSNGGSAAIVPDQLSSHNIQGAAFINDKWMVASRAAVDLGLRYFGQSVGKTVAFEPRLGFVYSPNATGNTIVRAGVGIFQSLVPLLATDFTGNPTRVVTSFDTSGNPVGSPVTFQNVCAIRGRVNLNIVPSCADLDATPYNLTWTTELDHQFGTHVVLRFSYLRSSTFRQFVVNPVQESATGGFLMMSNSGASRYHEVETTVTYRGDNQDEFTASYIHSRTRGNLNTLSDVFVPFEQPVIRPDAYSSLGADVPDRLITWGVFHLPHKFIFAPLLDWHTGFPYSKIDILQNYVGQPNTSRFPTFFSLDIRLWKWHALPGFLPFGLGHLKLRWGIAIRNVTNTNDPRDVYNNIASPYFNSFVGFQHRVYEVNVDTGG